MRNSIINLILRLGNQNLTFQQKCLRLEERLNNVQRQDLTDNLVEFSVLPESFFHDSSEEKLWAKFSDMLLAKSLGFLGFETEVIIQRGDTGDVKATNQIYSIIGDAKTSRLSLSTLNAKDLKIPSLDGWRGDDYQYSLMLASFGKFLRKKSRAYSEAVNHNVTIISYVHLSFLLLHYNNEDLERLWTIGRDLSERNYNFQEARPFWNAVDTMLCEILGKDINDFIAHKQVENKKIEILGQKEIKILKRQISEEKTRFEGISKNEIIQQLSENNTKEELIELLLGSSDSEKRIERIQKSINSLEILEASE